MAADGRSNEVGRRRQAQRGAATARAGRQIHADARTLHRCDSEERDNLEKHSDDATREVIDEHLEAGLDLASPQLAGDIALTSGVLMLDVRYELGLTSLDDTSSEADVKSRVFSMNAGFVF